MCPNMKAPKIPKPAPIERPAPILEQDSADRPGKVPERNRKRSQGNGRFRSGGSGSVSIPGIGDVN